MLPGPLVSRELYFFAISPARAIVCFGMRAYLGRAEFRDSVCRHRDVVPDKSVPVHRVTQYFRGRLANKGTSEEGKGYGEGWREGWSRRRVGRLVGRSVGWLADGLASLCERGPASVRVVSQVAIAV